METINSTPPGIVTLNKAGALSITRRWYKTKCWLLLAFSVFWNFAIYHLFKSLLASLPTDPAGLLFAIPHLVAGIIVTYLMMTGFLNKTVICIEDGKVHVRNGPLPWVGNKALHTQQIKNFFCDEKHSWTRSGPSISYSLSAVMSDGRKEVLVAAGVERDQVFYLKQVIENKLGIQSETT